MPVDPNTIRTGYCYVTHTGQHRVVLKIVDDKVWNAHRGKLVVKPDLWNLGHTKSSPPSLASFAKSVQRRLLPRPLDAARGRAVLAEAHLAKTGAI